MLEKFVAQLNAADNHTAIKMIEAQSDPQEIMQTYNELVRHLYYKEKNLPTMLMIGLAGIYYGLHHDSVDVQYVAKGISYNLASYTWVGWDEAGIDISAAETAIGLDMAKLNLRLAEELERGDLPISRAHWILGAQYLASGETDAAQKHFKKAGEYATKAAKQEEAWLAKAFGALASGDAEQLAQAKAQLNDANYEYGDALCEQVETAERVFAEG